MLSLKQFVSSEFCLNCRGCCIFKNDLWRPHLLDEERQILAKNEVQTGKEGESLVCEFLIRKEHKCRIYGKHPLECRLYPFLLVSTDNNACGLAAHLACLYVQNRLDTDEFNRYVAYLTDEWAKDAGVLKILKEQKRIFRSYPKEELKLLKEDIF
ncbi:MAG: YkgJ family cysteine cluster protein [Candidatus Omnitrophota bacterium]